MKTTRPRYLVSRIHEPGAPPSCSELLCGSPKSPRRVHHLVCAPWAFAGFSHRLTLLPLLRISCSSPPACFSRSFISLLQCPFSSGTSGSLIEVFPLPDMFQPFSCFTLLCGNLVFYLSWLTPQGSGNLTERVLPPLVFS